MSQSLFNEVEGSQPATDSDVSSGNHTFGSRAFGIDAQTVAPKKKKDFSSASSNISEKNN